MTAARSDYPCAEVVQCLLSSGVDAATKDSEVIAHTAPCADCVIHHQTLAGSAYARSRYPYQHVDLQYH